MIRTLPASSPIGSVLPAPPQGLPPLGGRSLWARWTSSHRRASSFDSARAALAALLPWRRIRRAWLPAYCCATLSDAVAAAGAELRWYGVGPGLVPDLRVLAADLRPGDAALSIAFFGVPAAAPMRAFAASRPDVLWIEDRSQCVDAGAPAWADVHLHSPRKLLGVADGGILVSDGCLPSPSALPAPRSRQAQMARRADAAGRFPATWLAAFRRQEACFGMEPRPMSETTARDLAAADPDVIGAARSANAAVLHRRLRAIALWPDAPPAAPPLAFPILVSDAAAAAAALSARGVHCARHWASLPSPADAFPEAHAISARLLSLPCDQHYDADHMERVADEVASLGLSPAGSAPASASPRSVRALWASAP